MNKLKQPDIDLNKVHECILSIDMTDSFEVYRANIDGFYVDTDYMLTGNMIEKLCKTFNVRVRNIQVRDSNKIHALFERIR